MINIFLCEDDLMQLNRWKEYVENFLIMHEPDMELYCWTTDPFTLLQYLETSESVGLYFLDIELQAKMNGMDLAKKIRIHDPRGYIVFITTHGEAAPLTFKNKLEALDFILKDEPEYLKEHINSCIQSTLNRYGDSLASDNRLITIKLPGSLVQMDQSDILFIAPVENSHQIVIHTLTGTRQFTGTMKEIAANLSEDFCYCNRSTIVNLRKVIRYTPKEKYLLMINGKQCRVSSRRTKEIQRKLFTKLLDIHPS